MSTGFAYVLFYDAHTDSSKCNFICGYINKRLNDPINSRLGNMPAIQNTKLSR